MGVEINLDRDKPERWESTAQKAQWELATARNAIKFKEQVESGKYIPEEVIRKLEGQIDLSPEEKEVCKRAAVLVKRRKKIAFLKVEAALVDLEIQPLMLKKQPEIVMTIRKLRKYVGPQDQSGYSEQEKKEIASGVKLIIARSGACYDKFSRLFPEFKTLANKGKDMQFHDYFQGQVDMLKAITKDWDETKLLSLSEEAQEETPES